MKFNKNSIIERLRRENIADIDYYNQKYNMYPVNIKYFEIFVGDFVYNIDYKIFTEALKKANVVIKKNKILENEVKYKIFLGIFMNFIRIYIIKEWPIFKLFL